MTVSKLGSIATISRLPYLFQIAIATAKYIRRSYRQERNTFIELIRRYFDPAINIFAFFFNFQTSELLAENSNRDWRDRAFAYVQPGTIVIGVQIQSIHKDRQCNLAHCATKLKQQQGLLLFFLYAFDMENYYYFTFGSHYFLFCH